MHFLDLIIAIPLLYFGYKGFMNGIVKEILNIVGITLGIFITFQYMDAFAVVIQPFFEEGASFIPFLSAAILFIGTMGIVALIAYLTKEFLKAIKLNMINRVFGAAFGILKSGMVVSTILLLLAGFSIPKEEVRDSSALYPYVIYIGPGAYEAIAFIYPGADSFSDTIEENLSKYNPIQNLPFPIQKQTEKDN